MENLLQGIDHLSVYIDKIVITGKPAETVLLMERLDASLVTAAQIRAWIGKRIQSL